jgi:hypothetical protein
VSVTVRSFLDGESSLADDVRDGLTRPFKGLRPKHFYDASGADFVPEQFEQVAFFDREHEWIEMRAAPLSEPALARRVFAATRVGNARVPGVATLLGALRRAAGYEGRRRRSSRRSRSTGPTTTPRSTIVPSGLGSGRNSIRFTRFRLAAQPHAEIKTAYEKFADPVVGRGGHNAGEA